MTVRYSEHPPMFRNHPFWFILCILLIPLFGLGLLILLGWRLQTKASKLSVGDHEILYEKGLLSKERSEINIQAVRATKVKQSFINRILGVGVIEIYTAGDTAEVIAAGMPDPNKVRELIKAELNER